jgi:hypothetical protein
MVLSTTKKTSSAASIMNQSTKGGNKKAGFPASIGRSTSMTIALRQTSQNSEVLKAPEASTVCSSRPVGSLPGNWRKC